jgi:two-component system nitrogen regulation sensor histidine kinase NtrY
LEGAVLILNDVTPFVQSQRTASWIAVAQKLAHEIKNPLTAIRLSLQRMKMEYENDPDLQKRLEELVEGSLDEAGRLRMVVDDFMRFSKIDAPKPELIRVEEIIENLTNRFSLIVPEQIAIETDIQEGLPSVMADESYLSTALSNLIDNAVHATAPPGEINIKVGMVEKINEDVKRPLEQMLEIEITDTGSGIEGDKITEVFQPFFTTKEGGSGLGLVIVQRIIDDHGGKIEMFSREGLGTRVTIQLPVSSQGVRNE